MELHYRGAVYESGSTPVEMTESDLVGQYRGAAMRFSKARRLPQQPKHHLRYRGAWVQ